MFERYTEAARRVLFFARYEASQFGSIGIEPEHLLLGLIREPHGLAARLLNDAGASSVALRRDLEGRLRVEPARSTTVEIPFTAPTTSVLARARAEAEDLHHPEIGSAHLLLGLLSADIAISMAVEVLRAHGVQVNDLRRALATMSADTRAQGEGGRPIRSDAGVPIGGHFGVSASGHGAPYFWSGVVTITPSSSDQGSETSVDGSWRLESIQLDFALERACEIPRTRMDIRASLPGSRFDIQAVQHGLPSRPLRCRLLEEALVRRFHLEITRESRLSDVYVMTAPDGHRMEESTPESLGASFASMDLHETLPSVDAADALPTPEAFRKAVSSRGFITSLEADAATVAELCDMLEGALDRPVVDETGIEGRFQIRLAGTAASNEEFFRMLDEQFGLVLTPGRRTVTTLVVQNA